MRGILLATGTAMVIYAVWLNRKSAMADCGCDKKLISKDPLAMARQAPVMGANWKQPMDTTSVVPDSWRQEFDARPFDTTVKVFARMRPIVGAGCAEEVSTYNQDYIFQ